MPDKTVATYKYAKKALGYYSQGFFSRKAVYISKSEYNVPRLYGGRGTRLF